MPFYRGSRREQAQRQHQNAGILGYLRRLKRFGQLSRRTSRRVADHVKAHEIISERLRA